MTVRRCMRAKAALTVVTAAAAMAAIGVASATAATPPIVLLPVTVPFGDLASPVAEALSPNGNTLYTADTQDGVLVINLKHPSVKPKQITIGSSQTQAGTPILGAETLAIAPNGKTLYISTGEKVYAAEVGNSELLANNTVTGTLSDPHSLVTEGLGLAVAPNGKQLYLANVNGTEAQVLTAKMTSASKGAFSSSYAIHQSVPFALAVNRAGSELYAGNAIGTASLVKLKSGTPAGARSLPQVKDSWGLALAPDGRTLYTSKVNFAQIQNGTETTGALQTFGVSSKGGVPSLAATRNLATGSFATGIGIAANGAEAAAGLGINLGNGDDTVPGILQKFAIPAAVTKVSISGDPKPGDKLTAKVKGASGASRSYRWFAAGKAIRGASKSTLKIGKQLAHRKLTVKVTAAATGYRTAAVTSAAVSVN
jgi:hypothetical protein